jgi:hypothetical protein
MAAASFRRLNVDQYDEDHSIPPNELVPENPLSDQDLVATVQSIAQQVRSFLQRGDTQSALATVLSCQPYGSSPALTQAKVCKLQIVTDPLDPTYG